MRTSLPRLLGLAALALASAAASEASAAGQQSGLAAIASKHVPGVTWRADSVLTADFSCRGRTEQAILGTSPTEIVIAVFVDGTGEPPELLRYSTQMRNPRVVRLTIESLDFDARGETGSDVPGFRRSRTCKGLNLSDEAVDAAHIYWNHDAGRFDEWSR